MADNRRVTVAQGAIHHVPRPRYARGQAPLCVTKLEKKNKPCNHPPTFHPERFDEDGNPLPRKCRAVGCECEVYTEEAALVS